MVRQLVEAIARRGLASAASLAANSYVAHQLATSAFGTFLGMLAFGQVLVIAFTVGLEVSPVYMLRNHSGQARRIWVATSAASLALAIACLLLGVLAVNHAPLEGDAAARLSQWGMAPFAYAAATVVLLPQFACLQGLLQLRTYNVLQVGYPLTVLTLVLAAGHQTLTPVLAVHCWALAGAGTAIVAAALLLRRVHAAGNPIEHNGLLPRRAFVGFSLQSYLANCIGTLNSRLPSLLAALALTPIAMGQFAGSLFLSDVFSFFSFAITSVTFPLLTGVKDSRQRSADLEKACRLNTTATLAAVTAFLLLFEPLCRLLLGSTFVSSEFRSMAGIVLACTVIHSTARLLCTDLASQGHPLLNALPNIPAAAVFAVLFGAMHGWEEPWGAVLAYCASSLCFSMLTVALYKSRCSIRLSAIGLATRSDWSAALTALRRQWER